MDLKTSGNSSVLLYVKGPAKNLYLPFCEFKHAYVGKEYKIVFIQGFGGQFEPKVVGGTGGPIYKLGGNYPREKTIVPNVPFPFTARQYDGRNLHYHTG